MAVFFKPSDIKTVACTVANLTRGGSSFAVCEDEEQVFINPKITEAMNIDVGDYLTAYCIDNFRPERGGEEQYAVRWRAIRVVVSERFNPVPVAAPAAPAPKPELTTEQIEQRILTLLKEDRAYTTAQAARDTGLDQMKIANVMRGLHDRGQIAACEISSSGGQERVSKLYYARDVGLMVDLIDEVVLDD